MRDIIIGISGLACSTICLELLHPYAMAWVEWLVLIAAWGVVPAGLKLYAGVRLYPLHWLAAASLSIAILPPIHWSSSVLALPWLAWSLYSFFRSLNWQNTADTFFSFALLFWVVAAIWATAHIADWQPLGFSPVIVLLTAAHFHYAGFTIMLLAALAHRSYPSNFVKGMGYLSIAATGMVAIAITVTKLTAWEVGEAISGTLMAAAGVLLATFHGWRANEQAPFTTWCWRVGSIFLLLGMALAANYALRLFLPFHLSIPEMQAWHGSMNTLALCLILLGWAVRKTSS